MTHKFVALAYVALAFSAARSARANHSFLCQEPGGKRLVHVVDKEISKASDDKTLIYVSGNDLLHNIHDPAFLVVDDNDVRHSSAGVVIATFDGNDIRHGRGGKVLINYQHPNLCPTSQDNRIYSIEGDPISKQQLVAALYILKPEMFALSDEETAAQQKAMKEAGEESDRLAHADQVAGKWTVLNGTGPVGKIGKGSITVSPKRGDAYPVAFDFTPGGGPAWNGAGFYKEMSGDKCFWVAYGTPKTTALCVYEIKGQSLSGKWYPWYVDGDAKNVGTEELTGPATLDGQYKIVSGKTPTTGAAYGGTVTIKPADIGEASDSAKPYNLVWDFGTVKSYGIGIRTKNYLFVATGSGADVNVAKYTIQNGSMSSDWFKLGSKEMGGSAASN